MHEQYRYVRKKCIFADRGDRECPVESGQPVMEGEIFETQSPTSESGYRFATTCRICDTSAEAIKTNFAS